MMQPTDCVRGSPGVTSQRNASRNVCDASNRLLEVAKQHKVSMMSSRVSQASLLDSEANILDSSTHLTYRMQTASVEAQLYAAGEFFFMAMAIARLLDVIPAYVRVTTPKIH